MRVRDPDRSDRLHGTDRFARAAAVAERKVDGRRGVEAIGKDRDRAVWTGRDALRALAPGGQHAGAEIDPRQPDPPCLLRIERSQRRQRAARADRRAAVAVGATVVLREVQHRREKRHDTVAAGIRTDDPRRARRRAVAATDADRAKAGSLHRTRRAQRRGNGPPGRPGRDRRRNANSRTENLAPRNRREARNRRRIGTPTQTGQQILHHAERAHPPAPRTRKQDREEHRNRDTEPRRDGHEIGRMPCHTSGCMDQREGIKPQKERPTERRRAEDRPEQHPPSPGRNAPRRPASQPSARVEHGSQRTRETADPARPRHGKHQQRNAECRDKRYGPRRHGGCQCRERACRGDQKRHPPWSRRRRGQGESDDQHDPARVETRSAPGRRLVGLRHAHAPGLSRDRRPARAGGPGGQRCRRCAARSPSSRTAPRTRRPRGRSGCSRQ